MKNKINHKGKKLTKNDYKIIDYGNSLGNCIKELNPRERPLIIRPASYISAMRYNNAISKERETIHWIGNMQEDSVLLDIGCNVGIYTIAAAFRGIRGIIAIDPAIDNCSELFKICEENSFKNVSIWCGTVTSQKAVSQAKPNIQQKEKWQQALNFIEDSDAGLGFTPIWRDNPKPENRLSPPIYPDQINNMNNIGITHVKIDVDGGEYDVIDSIKQLIKSPKLKSILIELRSKDDLRKMEEIIGPKGFRIDEDYMSHKINNHSDFRRERSNIPDKNYVFKKIT